MSQKITANLSVASIRKAQRQLLEYKRSLIPKCEKFVKTLANKGILVGEDNLGEFGKYVTFTLKTDTSRYGVRAVLSATNTGIIKSEWRQRDGSVREADVSPILMAEFGSGLRANNVRASEFGMGTGTFPDAKKENYENPEGWWYMDLEGNWHHSYGVTPTMPVGKAYAEILDQIETTAREVFGT